MRKTNIKLTIGILSTAILFSSCNHNSDKKTDNNQVDTSFKNELTEKQIGKSNYYISLPANYSIKETEGPDFSVYYFSPTDTTVNPKFSGGMYFGNFPHQFGPDNDSCKNERMKGEILSCAMEWTVYCCNAEYLIQTIVDSKSGEGWNTLIHAFGRGTSKKELNRLLEIYSTMKKK